MNNNINKIFAHQIEKQMPKTVLINAIKAIPDSLVNITFIENDPIVLISGKTNYASVKAIR